MNFDAALRSEEKNLKDITRFRAGDIKYTNYVFIGPTRSTGGLANIQDIERGLFRKWRNEDRITYTNQTKGYRRF